MMKQALRSRALKSCGRMSHVSETAHAVIGHVASALLMMTLVLLGGLRVLPRAHFGHYKSMAFRTLCAAVILMCLCSPARADLTADMQCDSTALTMQAIAKQCSATGGVVGGPDVLRCLAAHEADLSKTATTCVNAAESHYEAAASLTGQGADRELVAGATFLGLAAEANIFLANRSLARSQLDSVIAMTSKVLADPQSGELAGMAHSELALARRLVNALNSHP